MTTPPTTPAASDPYKVAYSFICECPHLPWPETGDDCLTDEQAAAVADLERRIHSSALASREVRELVKAAIESGLQYEYMLALWEAGAPMYPNQDGECKTRLDALRAALAPFAKETK